MKGAITSFDSVPFASRVNPFHFVTLKCLFTITFCQQGKPVHFVALKSLFTIKISIELSTLSCDVLCHNVLGGKPKERVTDHFRKPGLSKAKEAIEPKSKPKC